MIERLDVYPTITDPAHKKRMEDEINRAVVELANLSSKETRS